MVRTCIYQIYHLLWRRLCGYKYNPSPIAPRGISTQTSEFQQVVYLAYTCTPTKYDIYCES